MKKEETIWPYHGIAVLGIPSGNMLQMVVQRLGKDQVLALVMVPSSDILALEVTGFGLLRLLVAILNGLDIHKTVNLVILQLGLVHGIILTMLRM